MYGVFTYIWPTHSHEPIWGGVELKRKMTCTNVNIALDKIHFADKCDFETAKLQLNKPLLHNSS